MGPTIILDKSTLQALSQQEIYFLFKHYYVVVTPILIMEILADLKKSKDENQLSKDEVQRLSKKLLSMDSVINNDYKKLCVVSLLGENIPMTGQAIVSGGIPLETPNGKKVTFLDEPLERKALRNWQSGIFSNAEELLAELWREIAKEINLEEYKFEIKELLKNESRPKNFEELGIYVEKHISNPDPTIQYRCVGSFMNDLSIPQQLRDIIYERWLKQQLPMFRDFAPYAHYCFKANMLFYVGLSSDLISTRPSNVIDLHYLYYLPFCMVFSSGDKFHKNICRLLLRNDQVFIDLDDLKSDLRWLSTEWESLSEEEKRDRAYNYGIYPPVDPESVTYKLWQKYMKPWKPSSGNRAIKMTKEEQDRIIKQLQPIFEAINKYKHKE